MDEEDSDIDLEGLSDLDLDDLSEYGDEATESEESSGSSRSSGEESSTGGEDREYTGDMLKKTKAVKFAGAPF